VVFYICYFLKNFLFLCLYYLLLILVQLYIECWKLLAYKGSHVVWFLHLPLSAKFILYYYKIDEEYLFAMDLVGLDWYTLCYDVLRLGISPTYFFPIYHQEYIKLMETVIPVEVYGIEKKAFTEEQCIVRAYFNAVNIVHTNIKLTIPCNDISNTLLYIYWKIFPPQYDYRCMLLGANPWVRRIYTFSFFFIRFICFFETFKYKLSD